MAINVWPVDAVAGDPSYSGRELRQVQSAALAGASSARPLGARSGVRPGTPASTVAATATTWTVKPHAGILDTQSSAIAGPYWYAVDADVTGAVTAANATNPRKDILYVQLSDPAESDGSTVPGAAVAYLAGGAAPTPAPPALPARSMLLGTISVPVSGGGSPTVTWDAPYLGVGIIPARTTTERDALASLGNADCPVLVSVLGVIYSGDGTTWTRRSAHEIRAGGVSATTSAGGEISVTFTTAMSTASYAVSITDTNVGAGIGMILWKVRAKTTTGFVARAMPASGTTPVASLATTFDYTATEHA